MAARSRYSRGDTGKGGGSWASVVAGSAAITPPTSPAPVTIDREGCLYVILPPESRISITDVAIAVGQQGGDGGQWQPFMENGHIILQALTSGPGIDAQKMQFTSEGFPVKSITVKCAPLINSVNNKDLVEGRIEGLCASQEGQRLMEEHLKALGHLVAFNIETFPGSNKIPTGGATFLLDISEHGKAPKPHYILDFGTWCNHVRVNILGRQKFCYYCRENSHLRRDCPNAPKCFHCDSRSHSTSRCRATLDYPQVLDYGSPTMSPQPTEPGRPTASVSPPSSADAVLRDLVAGIARETPEHEERDHSLSSQSNGPVAQNSVAVPAPMRRSRSWAGQMEEDEDERQSAGINSTLSTQDVELTQEEGFQTVNRRASRARTKQKASQALSDLAKTHSKRNRRV